MQEKEAHVAGRLEVEEALLRKDQGKDETIRRLEEERGRLMERMQDKDDVVTRLEEEREKLLQRVQDGRAALRSCEDERDQSLRDAPEMDTMARKLQQVKDDALRQAEGSQVEVDTLQASARRLSENIAANELEIHSLRDKTKVYPFPRNPTPSLPSTYASVPLLLLPPAEAAPVVRVR